MHMMEKSWQLLTDLYQITMSYAYWRAGRMNDRATFSLYFRKNPFNGGFAVAAGLEPIVHFIEQFRFAPSDLDYLASLQNPDGQPMFPMEFLNFLQECQFSCDLEAVPEGSVVFPHEPLIRISGPIWQCQYLESIFLNAINFPTLIATKAARVSIAAEGDSVIEFGLRRAQGSDGALSASRAAYIGGVDSTSNVLAGKLFGIPVRGTHAHSWVMAFESEKAAFLEYAETLPQQSIFLVDTYQTLSGVKNAIEVGMLLRKKGHDLMGIRLDSGDLAYLSIEARKLLDSAGFHNTKIVASNELDEWVIQSLKRQGAKIDAWGVGTKLITAKDQPALNGVYKLSAIKEDGKWTYKIKVSDQHVKTSNPGIHCVRRFYNHSGGMEGDLIYNLEENPDQIQRIVDPLNPHRRKPIETTWKHKELLVPIFKEGKLVYRLPTLSEIRKHANQELKALHPGHKRFENPHEYPVGLSPSLVDLKSQLLDRAR